MVHHKIHDVNGRRSALAPHEAKMKRAPAAAEHRRHAEPAAVAAQCARLYKTVRRAFRGALPGRRGNAPGPPPKRTRRSTRRPTDKPAAAPTTTTTSTDEFYWAAAELFITTGKPEYQRLRRASRRYYKRFPTLMPGAGGGQPRR